MVLYTWPVADARTLYNLARYNTRLAAAAKSVTITNYLLMTFDVDHHCC
jgi:hypothetical protein